MTFLNPTYLWAFLGIIIPIAIHLWSRKKVITIKVGSTKLLTASEPKQTSTISPNEFLLLALRVLIIALLTLILSGLQFQKKEQNVKLTYLVEPSLVTSQKVNALFDSLPTESIGVLTKGFPDFEDYNFRKAPSSVPNYWQLALEMESLATDSIIVLTKGSITGIKGMRPSVDSRINWIVIDLEEESDAVVNAHKKDKEIELLSVFSNSKSTTFKNQLLANDSIESQTSTANDSIKIGGNSLPLQQEKSLKIGIIYEDSLVQEMKYISAAYRAVSIYLDEGIEVLTTTNSDSLDLDNLETTIWLGKEPIQPNRSPQLQFKPDAFSKDLISAGKAKNEFYLTSRLNSENIFSEHLAEGLSGLLKSDGKLLKKARPYDKRILDQEELNTRPLLNENKRQYAKLIDVSLWLWPILLVVLVFERIIAKIRKQ